MPKESVQKTVETISHIDDHRTNIPTAELQPIMKDEDMKPVPVSFTKRNPDLDPQLVWRGKYDGDDQLTVKSAPLYIQEKIHPSVLIKDLMHESKDKKNDNSLLQFFSDFNGYAKDANKTDFYQHEHNWTNRMILGDSLQVMVSLAEREGLRGKVQCIYMDPPYGIKFNSNFQWSTTSRDVKDGKLDNMTREPEQVKAFRDTWRDGIHSYLSYLRDRFILARELLTESGSIFVQIGDENVHHIRELMDEVFGKKNLAGQIIFVKTSGLSQKFLPDRYDTILWYFNDISRAKYKQLYKNKSIEDGTANTYKWARFVDGYMCSITKIDDNKNEYNIYKADNITSQGNPLIEFSFLNKKYTQRWKTNLEGLQKLAKSDRLHVAKNSLQYVRLISDFRCIPITKLWDDTATGSFTDDKIYVVQTGTKTIERCILMSTDPGDLVLDPTCGSGTTAYVAEQWGRRWITIDTSRVALALARMRLMGARYPWYIMTDSKEGQEKEAELNNVPPQKNPTYNNIKLGFVNERVPHITLKSIANNAEIDVIYDKWQEKLEPLRASFNKEVKESYEEWEIPRDEEEAILKSKKQHTTWSDKARDLHKQWWDARIARQKEIDASISAHAEYEYLYDRPYENKKIVRVAGPFTVESLSPHRVLGLGADNELIDPAADKPGEDGRDFEQMILDNLRTAGVQQAHKEDKIEFTSLEPFAGKMICAQGFYEESGTERKAAVFIGPEFGTVGRQDLVQAAREAGDFGFDVLVSCAFNYDAQSTELTNLGKIQILKARMNADLHMGDELKNSGKGNLFVIFGEPDIEIQQQKGDKIVVKLKGVDIFYPSTGEIRSSNADGIACWFIDTNYNDESFFVRHAYFLGANDPYKSLKTTLKAEVNREAWESLHSDVSRPFDKPQTGKIAVKVINHLGDEVLKVFAIQ